ncbi:hypothetical protein SO694_00123077 [Aureococcus anophagefferens]|uniref:Uncharacterized protein n=1 Tax=Aureococcus anophagefferens TaxID=44056 RepID=A0ABR1FIU1_AURAN
MDAVDASTPLAAGPARRRWPAAALAAAALGLVGASVALAPTRPVLSSLTIQDVDDAMVVECVARTTSTDLLVALGVSLGWQALPDPVGATILVDRGQFLELRGLDPDKGWTYDWEGSNAALVKFSYDATLAAVTTGARLDDPAWATTCTLDMSRRRAAPKSRVEDRFRFLDGGAYATCADPVEAAFVLAPDLVKSCLVAQARSVAQTCAATGSGATEHDGLDADGPVAGGARRTTTPDHDAPDHDAPGEDGPNAASQ